MQYFIVFAFCATVVFAEIITDKDKIDKIAVDCFLEKQLNPLWLTVASKTDVVEKSCFMECFLKKAGIIKQDGTYDIEGMLSGAKSPDIKKEAKQTIDMLMETCKTQAGSDKCKYAHCVGSMLGIF